MNKNPENFDNSFVYLLIKLEKNSSKIDRNESEKFTVNGWLVIPKINLKNCQSEDDYFREPLSKTYASNRGYTKVEIEDKISELITECNEKIRECKEKIKEFQTDEKFEISIEWILPEDLLSFPVDCWEYRKNKKIGCGPYYSVHVRSSRRLQSSYDHLRGYWQERWNLLINYSQNTNPKHYILACDCHGKDDNDLEIINEETKIFGINFASDLCEAKNLTYEFIIEAGIPLALWSRCKESNINHIQDLDKLTSCKTNQSWDLATLVKSIKTLRRLAKKDKVHLGNNLCFLWENPYNYPKKEKLGFN
ncbi:MAG: hypothetical protein QNJ33_10305 [Crocosphaera sp.]|nr:hypothetical protein [Crocosphaera sp.]